MRHWSWILTLFLSACATSDFGGPPATERAASLDDVTNGLASSSARGLDPSGNPLAGAFFNDGSEGDVRARTQFFSGPALAAPESEVVPQSGAVRQRDRKLVYSGMFSVEVAKVDEAMVGLLEFVAATGGYLQKQEDSRLSVRVPADKFDATIAWLREAGRMLTEARQAADVTEEFVDLGIRLDNARRARDRLLEVLKKSEKVPDILAVEKELRRLTEEIERMEGRLKVLRDRVAMATLHVTFHSVAAPQPTSARGGRSRFRWINRIGMRSILGAF